MEGCEKAGGMSEEYSRSSQIAKNTIMLYGRMLFVMAISLYTSRVILSALGIEDFGIYNVVGGIVTIFTMVSSSLQAAISRFITFAIGKKDMEYMRLIFSTSISIQWILALAFLVLAETLGLWFVNAKLVIPAERLTAANWVFQFSIATFFIQLISVPYNSCIIAHEKMSVFAYISIFEGISKLLVAILISFATVDRLILYSIFLAGISIIVRIVYGWYCKREFEECSFSLVYNKETFHQILSFAGWNIIGATSAVCRDQGGNILLNLFGGPVVNAARGIAIQVNGAVLGFVSNFQTAINPQIIKSYATGDKEYLLKLIFLGARFSFYILLIILIPLCVNAEYVLHLWLKDVPDFTTEFTVLVLLFSLVESISGPLTVSVYATGKIKSTQIIVGGLQMLNFPISYLLLRLGYSPISVYIIAILVSIFCLIARLFILRGLIGLSVARFIKDVLFKCCLITVISILAPILFFRMCPTENFGTFTASCAVSLVYSGAVVFFMGCDKNERHLITEKAHSILAKFRCSN